jgi:hypothetical protein
MTRRRTLLALLAALGAGVVLWAVATRPRAAGVELKFVGFATNGAAILQLQNGSARDIGIYWVQRGMPLWLRSSPRVFELGPASNRVIHARSTAIYHVMLPADGPWRVSVRHYPVPGWREHVRYGLERARLLGHKSMVIETATSELFTNAPPLP